MLATEILVHADAHDLTAQGDDRMTQRRLIAHMDAVRRHMLRIRGPFLHERRADVRVVAGHDLDAFGQARLTVVLHDDIAVHAVARIDHKVQRVEVETIAMHLHEDRLVRLSQHVHDGGRAHAVPFHHRHAVVGLAHRAAQIAADIHAAHLHDRLIDRGAVDVPHVHACRAARLEHVEELLDALDRREAPIFLLARRHGEIGQVERAWVGVCARRHRRGHSVRVVGIRDRDVDFFAVCHRSAHRSFHLQFDKAIELKRVFHRQLTADRFDEPAHDHRHRLFFFDATAHQVEQLVF